MCPLFAFEGSEHLVLVPRNSWIYYVYRIHSFCIAFLLSSEAGLLRALYEQKVKDANSAEGKSASLTASPEAAAAAGEGVTVEQDAIEEEGLTAGGHEEGEEEEPAAADEEVEDTKADEEKDVS